MLNRANLAIAKFTNKIPEFQSLPTAGVLVSPKHTVATDGHRIVSVAMTEAKAEQFPNFEGFTATKEFEPFILKRDDALAVCAAIPKGGEVKLWPVRHAGVNESNTSELATNDLQTKHLFKTEHIAGNFPKYQAVIPEKDRADFTTEVNAKLLFELLKAVVEANPGMPFVEIRFYKSASAEEAKAIRLDAETEDKQEWIAALMPLR